VVALPQRVEQLLGVVVHVSASPASRGERVTEREVVAGGLLVARRRTRSDQERRDDRGDQGGKPDLHRILLGSDGNVEPTCFSTPRNRG
jgi:hypothetical protein